MKPTLVVVCMCVFLCLNGRAHAQQKPVVDSVIIVSHSFSTCFFGGMTPRSLIRLCTEQRSVEHTGCDVVSVADAPFMEYLSQRIAALSDEDTLDREYSGVDARVACLLYQQEGRQIDTVSFGDNTGLNPPSMLVNGKYYRLYKELLRAIAAQVLENRIDILRYLDKTVPGYEKLLEDYYREHPDEPDRR